jgi:ribosome maturation factor RimP
VERPLVRRRDFERFAGREVVLLGRQAIHGTAKRIEGQLVGLEGPDDAERIRIRLASGEELLVPREFTKKIHLVYRWGTKGG